MGNTSIRSLRSSVLAAAATWLFVAACGADLEPAGSPVYLALGDSLGVGVGANDWPTGGYVPRLLERLNDGRPAGSQLELANVARSGADTRTVIDDGQLTEALAVIEAARRTAATTDDVDVITVGLGGNDAFELFAICGGVVDDVCLSAARDRIGQVRTNLLVIIRALRDAAGPDVPIAVMTYYNPLAHPSCRLHDFELIGDVVLEGQPALGLDLGLNDEIRAAAAAANVSVAEVGELTVDEITGDCFHANDAGHARIAAAFEAALRP